MFRLVPPAGTPLRSSQVLSALREAAAANGHGKQTLDNFAVQLGARYAFGASSGRAALLTILRALRRLRPQAEIVALPAYTCFSVAAAVVRAGLQIHLMDVNPETLDLEVSTEDSLPAKNLLCAVTANLFGYANDVRPLREMSRARNAFLVDDAAQALGAWREGKPAGMRGDAGLFSLGRGKALSTIEGGLIVTHSEEFADAVRKDVALLRPATAMHGAWLLLQLLGYSVLLRPGLYRIPRSIPFLKLGATEFDPGFSVNCLHPLSLSLFLSLVDGLETINEIRRANSTWMIEALESNAKFRVPRPSTNTRATMVRLPVIARDETTRTLAIKRLRKAGIEASAFYPSAICDIEGIGAHMSKPFIHRAGAEQLSRTLLTLPVHPLVDRRDMERAAEVLYSV
jgi:dTDP-4-amino-4,6-dideoxygalactose transaminase